MIESSAADETSAPVMHSGHTPNFPHWNSGSAILLWVVSVLLILIVPAVFLLPYLLLYGDSAMSNTEVIEQLSSDKIAILLQIAAIIPAHLITLYLAWAVITRRGTFSFKQMLGWASGGMKWWHHVVILLGVIAVSVVIGNYFPEQDNQLLRIIRSSKAAVYFISVMAVFTAPIVEEVIYRGLLYSAFKKQFGSYFAISSVTFLFTLVHVPQYYESPSTLGLLALVSLVITLIRHYSGNLLPCIIFHTLFNLFNAVLMIASQNVPETPPLADPAAIILCSLI